MPSGLKNAQSARHKALRKLGPKAHQHPPRSQRGAGEPLLGDLQVRAAGSTLERKAGLNQLGAPTPYKALRVVRQQSGTGRPSGIRGMLRYRAVSKALAWAG